MIIHYPRPTVSLGGKLLRHGTAYTVARVANYGVIYALLPAYAHLIGDAGYGLLEVLAAASSLLALIFLQGLGGSFFRLRFDHRGDDLAAFEGTIVWYLVASTAAGVGLLVLFGDPLADLVLPGAGFFPLGLLAVLGAAGSVLPRLYEARLQADQRPYAFAAFCIGRAALTAAVILVFVVALDRGVRGKLEAEAIAVGGATLLALVLLRPRATIERRHLRRSLAYGLPLVPHGIAVLVNNLVDRLLLGRMIGLGATGVYALGFQVGYVGGVLAIAANQAFAPLFIRGYHDAEEADRRGDGGEAARLRRALADAALGGAAAVACVALAATGTARELIALIAPAAFSESWTVAAPVAAGSLAWACYFPFSQSILYRPAAVRMIPVVTIAAALVNVGANLLLIPRLGIMAAGWATLASNAVMALLALWMGQTAAPLPHRYRRWLLLCAWTGAHLAGLWWLDELGDPAALRIGAKALWVPLACLGALRIAGVRPTSIPAAMRPGRVSSPP